MSAGVDVAIKANTNDRKKLFFNDKNIIDKTEQGTERALSAIGAYVQRVAINSMKDGGPRPQKRQGRANFVLKLAPPKKSVPGQPPLYHLGLLRGRRGIPGPGIHFDKDYKGSKKTVRIGPDALKSPLPQSPQAPEALEFGLMVRFIEPKWRRVDGRNQKVGLKMRTANYKPHPFMRPALAKTQAQGIIEKHFKNIYYAKSIGASMVA